LESSHNVPVTPQECPSYQTGPITESPAPEKTRHPATGRTPPATADPAPGSARQRHVSATRAPPWYCPKFRAGAETSTYRRRFPPTVPLAARPAHPCWHTRSARPFPKQPGAPTCPPLDWSRPMAWTVLDSPPPTEAYSTNAAGRRRADLRDGIKRAAAPALPDWPH